MRNQPPRLARGLSLIELLAVIAIIALLTGVLLPSLHSARGAARAAACAASLRQLTSLVQLYAGDNKGSAPAGAPNFLANRVRWFGSRPAPGATFTSNAGTLSAYLEASGSLRECAAFASRLAELAARGEGFERGCGGYGYNNAYVGVNRGQDGRLVTDRVGERLERFTRPAATVLFGDAAFAAGTTGSASVIEYSFIEPRWTPESPAANVSPTAGGDRGGFAAGTRPDPSLHFRHAGRAAIGWLDGHVSSESRTLTDSSGLYPGDPLEAGVGWFGSHDDNRLFCGQ